MKKAYLEDADPETAAATVRDVLARRGADLQETTPYRTTFDELQPREGEFAREGYVGTYQHAGEDDVELRVTVRAAGPARAFWRTVVAELAIIFVLVVLDPDPDVWFWVFVVLVLALGGTGLVYLGTLRRSRALEADLLDATVEGLADQEAAERILTEEDRDLEAFEAELEAEVAELRLKEERAARRRERRAALGDRVAGGIASLRDRVSPDDDEPAKVDADREPEPREEPAPELEDEAPEPEVDPQEVAERRRRLEDLRDRVQELRERKAEAEAAASSGEPEDEVAAKRRRVRELREEIRRRRAEEGAED